MNPRHFFKFTNKLKSTKNTCALYLQEYLNDSGREDNLFSDPTFDKFTDTFDDIIAKDNLLDNSGMHSSFISFFWCR